MCICARKLLEIGSHKPFSLQPRQSSDIRPHRQAQHSTWMTVRLQHQPRRRRRVLQSIFSLSSAPPAPVHYQSTVVPTSISAEQKFETYNFSLSRCWLKADMRYVTCAEPLSSPTHLFLFRHGREKKITPTFSPHHLPPPSFSLYLLLVVTSTYSLTLHHSADTAHRHNATLTFRFLHLPQHGNLKISLLVASAFRPTRWD